jgi:hypothetical protein
MEATPKIDDCDPVRIAAAGAKPKPTINDK